MDYIVTEYIVLWKQEGTFDVDIDKMKSIFIAINLVVICDSLNRICSHE